MPPLADEVLQVRGLIPLSLGVARCPISCGGLLADPWGTAADSLHSLVRVTSSAETSIGAGFRGFRWSLKVDSLSLALGEYWVTVVCQGTGL